MECMLKAFNSKIYKSRTEKENESESERMKIIAMKICIEF